MATSSPERDRSFDPPKSAFLFFAYAVSASIAAVYFTFNGPTGAGLFLGLTAAILWVVFIAMWRSHYLNVTNPQPQLATLKAPMWTRLPWLALQVVIAGGIIWVWFAVDAPPDRSGDTMIFPFAIGAAWLVTMILTAWIEAGKSIARKVKGRSHRNPPPQGASSPHLPEHRARLHREPVGPRQE